MRGQLERRDLARAPAHELLSFRSVSISGTPPLPATLQTSTTDAGEITCAAPVLVYSGAPPEYPMLATPGAPTLPRGN